MYERAMWEVLLINKQGFAVFIGRDLAECRVERWDCVRDP